MFIALGIPIDIIQVGDANSNSVISAIANSDSLIEVKMKLKCPKCLTSRKMTFCKALINLEDVICPECDAKVVWELKDIQSNVPIWS